MNTYGQFIRVTIFGESHGPGIGVVVDGLPAGETSPRREKKPTSR